MTDVSDAAFIKQCRLNQEQVVQPNRTIVRLLSIVEQCPWCSSASATSQSDNRIFLDRAWDQFIAFSVEHGTLPLKPVDMHRLWSLARGSTSTVCDDRAERDALQAELSALSTKKDEEINRLMHYHSVYKSGMIEDLNRLVNELSALRARVPGVTPEMVTVASRTFDESHCLGLYDKMRDAVIVAFEHAAPAPKPHDVSRSPTLAMLRAGHDVLAKIYPPKVNGGAAIGQQIVWEAMWDAAFCRTVETSSLAPEPRDTPARTFADGIEAAAEEADSFCADSFFSSDRKIARDIARAIRALAKTDKEGTP